MYALLYDPVLTFTTLGLSRAITAYIMLDSVKYLLFTYSLLTSDFDLHVMNSMNSTPDYDYLLCNGFVHDRDPGGALGYLGGRIRSLSKFKNTPKALISGQKSTLILIKTLTFSTKNTPLLLSKH